MDVATLADRLREAADQHHHYEQTSPEHDWAEWYAPTSSRASRGAPRRRHPVLPRAMWRVPADGQSSRAVAAA